MLNAHFKRKTTKTIKQTKQKERNCLMKDENRKDGVNMSQCMSVGLGSLSQKQTGESRLKCVWCDEKYRIATL